MLILYFILDSILCLGAGFGVRHYFSNKQLKIFINFLTGIKDISEVRIRRESQLLLEKLK